jgi:hypothetical protein
MNDSAVGNVADDKTPASARDSNNSVKVCTQTLRVSGS